MKRTGRTIAIALWVLSLSVYAAAQGKIRATIEAEGQRFTAELKKGDAAALAAMYATDAKAFPPNGDIAEGRVAIRKVWQDAIDAGMRDLSFTVLEVERKGNIVYEVGKYSLRGADGKEVDAGKYIVIWKQEGGKWRLFLDIWNSSLPVPVPAK